MADGDQGIFTFPGITGVLSAELTITNGISPSVTKVSVPPLSAFNRVGTAQWSYGGSVVRLFPNSAVSRNEEVRPNGQRIWNLFIKDRRWAWQFEQISGEYNIGVEGKVIPEYAKNARELATLCFEALGEVGFNVSALTTDTRPYVKWELANPAKALAELCDIYSCEVSAPRLDNTFAIIRKGVGTNLPSNFLTRTTMFDPKELPKKLAAVSGPIQWQVDLPLRPVGFELDDQEPKPIDDLSYVPTGAATDLGGKGNNKEPDSWLDAVNDSFDFIGGEETRKLAEDTIFKVFQVSIENLEGGIVPHEPPPGAPGPKWQLIGALVEVENLAQILPLIGSQIETTGGNFSEKRQECVVWGGFDEGEPFASSQLDDPDADIGIDDYNPKYHYEGRFTLDVDRGLVTFPEEMFSYDKNPAAAGRIQLPQLYLRCTVNLYHKESRQPQRYYREIAVDPTSPAGTRYNTHNDVVLTNHRTYQSPSWTTNKDEVEQQLNFYLAQYVEQLKAYPSSTADYEGFVAINLDGAIQQVSYRINGSHLATTTINRNFQDLTRVISIEKKKNDDKLKSALDERERVRAFDKQAKKDDKKIG